jgi:peptidoglycan/LPS O-acetylase OafA/YrhL
VSTEWAGYLLFPALWLLMGRLPNRWAGCILGLCLPVLAVVDFRSGHGLNLTYAYALLRFFPEFVAGMATARLLPLLAERVRGAVLAGLGLAVILLALMLRADVFVVAGLWAVLTAFAAQAAAGRPGILPNLPILKFLGVLSYAFYMSFGTIELFLAQLFRHQGWDPASHKLAYAAAMTGLTFLLALSLHSLVEIPARQRVDGWLKQRRPAFSETPAEKTLF